MSVQDNNEYYKRSSKQCFNTSYVSVQVSAEAIAAITARFQYILCVGSSPFPSYNIYRLFLFQYILCVGSRISTRYCYWFFCVSIHPMCRFKVVKVDINGRVTNVSIHPMCRFKF